MAHALLSPSSAARWLTCTPSAVLESKCEDVTTDAAREGTEAHMLAELKVQRLTGVLSAEEYKKEWKLFNENSEYYDGEMEEATELYADIIAEKLNEARERSKDALAFAEQEVDLSRVVPGGFGTVDTTIIADGLMEIVDFKYGKGVKVDAEGNPQLRLYGLGMYLDQSIFYKIERVCMTIVQPRLGNISSEEMSVADLMEWGAKVVAPKAELAAKGEGEFVPGESQCRFCKAKTLCRARAEENLKTAREDFALPPELSTDEVAELLPRLDELQAWAKDLQEWAQDQAVNHGVTFKGYKVVAGRSNRKYTDEGAVAEKLLASGYEHDDIFEEKLLRITQMEKLLGKKKTAELIGDLIEKPAGKPTLVPESDKRPAMNSADEAAKDFKEE